MIDTEIRFVDCLNRLDLNPKDHQSINSLSALVSNAEDIKFLIKSAQGAHKGHTFYALLNALQEAGHYPEAIAICKLLMSNSAHDEVQLNTRLGSLYEKTRQLEEAIDTYTKVLKVDSGSGHAHQRLSVLKHAMGFYEEGMVHLREYTKHNNFSAGIALEAVDPHHDSIIESFNRKYYYSLAWGDTYWMGVPVLKCPTDLWIYQELIFRLKPDLIIETGTFYGGSALYLASMCELIGHGQILTIDTEEWPNNVKHERVTFLKGSSIDIEILNEVKKRSINSRSTLVILDSCHERDFVLKEMEVYQKFVTPGSYLVVEDTNLGGHPVWPEHGPGPKEAIEKFLQENAQFKHDQGQGKFLLSFNKGGYLKRI